MHSGQLTLSSGSCVAWIIYPSATAPQTTGKPESQLSVYGLAHQWDRQNDADSPTLSFINLGYFLSAHEALTFLSLPQAINSLCSCMFLCLYLCLWDNESMSLLWGNCRTLINCICQKMAAVMTFLKQIMALRSFPAAIYNHTSCGLVRDLTHVTSDHMTSVKKTDPTL